MKVFFVAFMCALLALLPAGIKRLYSRKNSLYLRMFNVLVVASLSVIAHIVIILTQNENIALVAYSFYFASSTWISALVFSFCAHYLESKRSQKIFKFVVLPLTIVDNIVVFANIFNEIMFSVYYMRWGKDFYIQTVPQLPFLIHVAFGQILLYCCLFLLVRKVFKVPPVYRIKYYSLILSLFLICVSTLLHICLDIPFNFSILVYAACFCYFYYVHTKKIPGSLIRKTLSLVADTLPSGIILFDENGTCIYVNEFVKKILHKDETSVLDLDFIADFDRELENYRKKNFQLKTNLFNNPENVELEFDYHTKNERRILKIAKVQISETYAPSPFNSQKITSVIGTTYRISDITKEKNEQYEQNFLLTRDKLTGLFNASCFSEQMERRLKTDKFTTYYLLVSDIVNFKLVNDLHGKPFGDMILMRIAEKIRSFARADDIYARLYNDHFAILMPKRRFDEETFISYFSETFSYLNNFSYSIVWHMGIYEVTGSAPDAENTTISAMLDRAFLALNSIKNDYKSCFAFYDEKLRNEVLKMQTLMNELPQALQFGELKMYLQPQFTRDGSVLGAEALVRWHHPTKGIISPTEFIQVIEKINMISDVDKFIWRCACQKLSEYKKEGRTDFYISVNISPKDFYTMDLYETFTSLVREFDISPKNLKLEITETAVIMDLDQQVSLLDRLRNFGFTLEMDDFGSGYSSLNMLKDISVDVLKIDMAFLQKSQNDKKSRIILEKIIMLAKELGMTVVTEGVEEKEQIEFLSEFGCDLFQGFYLSKPIPVADFEKKYFTAKA